MNDKPRGRNTVAKLVWAVIASLVWVLALSWFAGFAVDHCLQTAGAGATAKSVCEGWKASIAFFGLIAMMGLMGLYVTSTE